MGLNSDPTWRIAWYPFQYRSLPAKKRSYGMPSGYMRRPGTRRLRVRRISAWSTVSPASDPVSPSSWRLDDAAPGSGPTRSGEGPPIRRRPTPIKPPLHPRDAANAANLFPVVSVRPENARGIRQLQTFRFPIPADRRLLHQLAHAARQIEDQNSTGHRQTKRWQCRRKLLGGPSVNPHGESEDVSTCVGETGRGRVSKGQQAPGIAWPNPVSGLPRSQR